MCSGFRSLIGHNSSLFRHIIGIHQFYYPANSQRANYLSTSRNIELKEPGTSFLAAWKMRF
ncbi:hypothetical protein DENIS_0115 [Desulfonema ishimotonii]|uniref:Uncharacterized protein n=1 Tax=Desulfonema ishimotonii TaxID=45657 RepID=A0A401FQB4_9BACT|nr:hypothetical protein DENIS_0115 [Desulfonema ishimotonii]